LVCHHIRSDQVGMGQQSVEGFEEAITKGFPMPKERVVFHSNIPRYQGPNAKYALDYDRLTTDPELQMEFMDYFLDAKVHNKVAAKGLDRVQQMATSYNGSAAKETYGRLVKNCTPCVLKLINRHSMDISGSEAQACIQLTNPPPRRK
jgi:hypothetical protein